MYAGMVPCRYMYDNAFTDIEHMEHSGRLFEADIAPVRDIKQVNQKLGQMQQMLAGRIEST